MEGQGEFTFSFTEFPQGTAEPQDAGSTNWFSFEEPKEEAKQDFGFTFPAPVSEAPPKDPLAAASFMDVGATSTAEVKEEAVTETESVDTFSLPAAVSAPSTEETTAATDASVGNTDLFSFALPEARPASDVERKEALQSTETESEAKTQESDGSEGPSTAAIEIAEEKEEPRNIDSSSGGKADVLTLAPVEEKEPRAIETETGTDAFSFSFPATAVEASEPAVGKEEEPKSIETETSAKRPENEFSFAFPATTPVPVAETKEERTSQGQEFAFTFPVTTAAPDTPKNEVGSNESSDPKAPETNAPAEFSFTFPESPTVAPAKSESETGTGKPEFSFTFPEPTTNAKATSTGDSSGFAFTFPEPAAAQMQSQGSNSSLQRDVTEAKPAEEPVRVRLTAADEDDSFRDFKVLMHNPVFRKDQADVKKYFAIPDEGDSLEEALSFLLRTAK